MCGCGGIGRRVRFRFLWSQGCAGSSPVIRTRTARCERRAQKERAISPLFIYARKC